MYISKKIISWFCSCIIIAVPMNQNALAKDSIRVTYYAVKRLVYTNYGEYGANAYVRFIDADTDKVVDDSNDKAAAWEEQRAWNLASEKISGWLNNRTVELEKGDEVWLRLSIILGDTKGCRKDTVRFIFDPKGGVVKYYSRGTTKHNNRCRVKSLPASRHKIRVELEER